MSSEKPAPPHVRPNVVVAFNKGVTEKQASAVLDALNVPFHSGSDSSRGKAFFYAHGPQFLLTIDPARVKWLRGELQKSALVAESWEADWDVQKD